MSAPSVLLRSSLGSLLRWCPIGGRGRNVATSARLDHLRHRCGHIGSQEARPAHGQPVHADLYGPIDVSGNSPSRKQPTRKRPQRRGDNPSPDPGALRRRGFRGLGRLRQRARRSQRLLLGWPGVVARIRRRPARPSARWGRVSIDHGSRHAAIRPSIVRYRHSASLAQFNQGGYLEDAQAAQRRG